MCTWRRPTRTRRLARAASGGLEEAMLLRDGLLCLAATLVVCSAASGCTATASYPDGREEERCAQRALACACMDAMQCPRSTMLLLAVNALWRARRGRKRLRPARASTRRWRGSRTRAGCGMSGARCSRLQKTLLLQSFCVLKREMGARRQVIFRADGSFLAPAENCERPGNRACARS